MQANKKNYPKFIFSLILCLLVRLIPLRAPNVEPILTTLMPVSLAYGAFASFLFAISSILAYDLVTKTIGIQTFFTVFAYGIVGLWSASYFKKNKANKWGYVRFAVIGTLVFDALTGLTVGPIFFHQSFVTSLVGQIPFTALHLISNVAFAFVLSPVIHNFLIRKRERQIENKSSIIINNLQPKII